MQSYRGMRNCFYRTKIFSLGLLLTSFFNCAESTDLRFLDTQSDRLSLRGTICTEDPRVISNPVKIMFIVDISGSMGPHNQNGQAHPGNDPTFLRADAVQAVINEFNPIEAYEFGIIRFNGSATLATNPDGFTKNPTLLSSAVNSLRQDDGGTGMGDAINLAASTIIDDVQQMIEDGESAAQTKYVVLMLSDGQPQVLGSTLEEAKQSARNAITFLMDLKDTLDIGALFFHGAFLGDDAEGRTFMQELVTLADNGIFMEFRDASQIDFLEKNLNFAPLKISKSLVDIFVFNRNARSQSIARSKATIMVDSDGDGLTDQEEIELGTSPLLKDSDGDLISDYVEYLRSLDPLVADTLCDAENSDQDDDLDGLSNCDEDMLLTERIEVDTDGDGIIDLLEVLMGTDPRVADAHLDSDGDGMSNIEEIKRGMNPTIDDSHLFDSSAYRYSLSFIEIDDEGNYCYEVDVSNIRLVETLPLSQGANPINQLEVYLQTRYTDGSDTDDFLRAKVDVDLYNFRSNFDNNVIRIETLNFELLGNDV